MKNIVVAMTGASGAIYGIRLLEEIGKSRDWETHLIISRWAEETIRLETDYSVDQVTGLADRSYDENDLAAPISSGSFPTEAMVIVPASMKTLAAIACGFDSTLIVRAADVAIKEKRQLIVVPREAPLSVIHLRNLTTLASAGVSVVPPVPGFYSKPETIDDIINHTVGKILDQLKIPHSLYTRWGDGSDARR
jgi:polyprenyl P-hydroxybenzoate/phenylacrylic acid decarboxylase-like protein